MSTFMGIGAGVRPTFSHKTAAYTVKESDVGTTFTNYGAAGAVTFTLPAISTGPWAFTFLCAADQDLVVAAETVDTMITFNDAAADSLAFSTAAEKLGGAIHVWCDGTILFATCSLASDAQTPVVAT